MVQTMLKMNQGSMSSPSRAIRSSGIGLSPCNSHARVRRGAGRGHSHDRRQNARAGPSLTDRSHRCALLVTTVACVSFMEIRNRFTNSVKVTKCNKT